MLKLNTDKTEVIVFASNQNADITRDISVNVIIFFVLWHGIFVVKVAHLKWSVSKNEL
jgi:hypothetical protein